MSKKNILIIYYSRSGNTKKMAELVMQGIDNENINVTMMKVDDAKTEDLVKTDGIIIGTPTYYGLPASPIIELLDKSVKYHGELSGKVGSAFSSSANIGGGNETAIMAILQAFLVHGMIIKGSAQGDHYGPVSIGSPNDRVKLQCKNLGKRVADLVLQLGETISE